MDSDPRENEAEGASDRRAFLVAAGKFAAVTPPAMTILLSTSLASPAIAASGGGTFDPPGNGPPSDFPGRGPPPGRGPNR